MLKKVFSGMAAGLMVAMGGCVYMACDNKYAGAVLFSVALLTICIKGYSLYTGRIGYIVCDRSEEYLSALFLGLLGNTIAAVIAGLLARAAVPAIASAAETACSAKLGQSLISAFIRGSFCGVLMYTAVSIYKEAKNLSGIFFCIPVFILSGFEHSIADMFYFAAAGMFSVKVSFFILAVILGNSVGAAVLPLLEGKGKK